MEETGHHLFPPGSKLGAISIYADFNRMGRGTDTKNGICKTLFYVILSYVSLAFFLFIGFSEALMYRVFSFILSSFMKIVKIACLFIITFLFRRTNPDSCLCY